MHDRFDLLHSVIAVRQLIGKPIDAEKDIPVDLLEIMNNPPQLNWKSYITRLQENLQEKRNLVKIGKTPYSPI